MTVSVFDTLDVKSYPIRFAGALHLDVIVGGIPSDPNVAEGWLKSKLQTTDERIRALVAETMVDRKVDPDEAAKIVNSMKNLNGFKRDATTDIAVAAREKALADREEFLANLEDDSNAERKFQEYVDHIGELYVEGRQLKAALKEAVSVAVAAKKIDMTGYGATRKWLTNYFPEHVFVLEKKLYLGVTEPSGVFQQFVHTHRGSSIQYQEYVEDCGLEFTVITDHPFTKDEWAMIWTTGQKQGLGASRSQGYGEYTVTKWQDISTGPKPQPTRVSTKTKN